MTHTQQEALLANTADGAECPLCKTGTVEHKDGWVTCRGECGSWIENANPPKPGIMTYTELNDLTHEVADKIDEATGGDQSGVDRCEVNDMLSAFLQGQGITFTEDDDDDE
jgi:hypothetical protein